MVKAMRKIKSKKILSLVVFFLVILILFFSAYKVLSNGIEIKKISLGKIAVERLYLKLDKKFILEVGTLDLQELLKTPSKEPLDIDDISSNLKYFTWGIAYFQKLSIEKILLDKNNTARVLYDGKQYNLLFPDIEAHFNIQEENNLLHLEIQKLLLKQFLVDAKGKILYLPAKQEMSFDLTLNQTQSNYSFFVQGKTDLKKLRIKAKSSTIRSLSFLKPYLADIDEPELHDWLFQKIFFDSAKVEQLSFETTLTDKGFLSGIEKSMEALININAPEVTLFNDLDPIRAQSVKATIKNKKITLEIENPNYGEINLAGSSLEFDNLLKAPRISVFIKSDAFFYNKSLIELLQHYELPLPIQKIDSALSADLKLSMQFLHANEMLLSLSGGIKTQNSNISLFDIPIFAENTNVSFDITPQYGYVYVKADNAYYYNMIRADLDGTLDIHKHSYKSQVKISKAHINTNQAINFSRPFLGESRDEDSEENASSLDAQIFSKSPSTLTPSELKKLILASIKEDETPFTQKILYLPPEETLNTEVEVDFENPEDISVKLEDFKLALQVQKDAFVIKLDDFSTLTPYSPLLSYLAITSGNAQITTSDFKDFDFLATIQNLNIPLYDANGESVKSLEFSGFIKDDLIQVSSLDKNIHFTRKDSQNKIQIKGYNFSADEFLESKIPAIQQALHGDSSGVSPSKEQIANKLEFLKYKHQYQVRHNIKSQMTNIEISGMNIYYKEYTLPSEDINIRFRDQRILGDLTYKNGIANIDFIDGVIYIKANNFSADFINSVIQKQILNGGLFTLLGAYKNGAFTGELKIQNTLFENFVVLQNIINLIDTVPSLIVFKNPNLGARGYQVSKGSIIFGINKDYLGLEKIHLVGDSMDIDGNGIMQLDNEEMNINLTISTIKNLSNILSKIPIVGYLVLGDDGKISTNLTLNGTFSDPKTSVSLAEDVISAPFKILRRVFTPIDLIVDEIKSEIKDDDYRK